MCYIWHTPRSGPARARKHGHSARIGSTRAQQQKRPIYLLFVCFSVGNYLSLRVYLFACHAFAPIGMTFNLFHRNSCVCVRVCCNTRRNVICDWPLVFIYEFGATLFCVAIYLYGKYNKIIGHWRLAFWC